jgi:hypothetical protein
MLGICEGPQLDECIQRDSGPGLGSQTLTNFRAQRPFRYGQLQTVWQSHNHNRSIAASSQITNLFNFLFPRFVFLECAFLLIYRSLPFMAASATVLLAGIPPFRPRQERTKRQKRRRRRLLGFRLPTGNFVWIYPLPLLRRPAVHLVRHRDSGRRASESRAGEGQILKNLGVVRYDWSRERRLYVLRPRVFRGKSAKD